MPDTLHAEQASLQRYLAHSYATGGLTLADLLSIVSILGQARDTETLRFLVRGFASTFPILSLYTNHTEERGQTMQDQERRQAINARLKGKQRRQDP